MAALLATISLTMGASLGKTSYMMYHELDQRVMKHDRLLAKLEDLPDRVERMRVELVSEIRQNLNRK